MTTKWGKAMPYKLKLAVASKILDSNGNKLYEKRILKNREQTRRWKKTPHGAKKVKEYAKKYRAKHKALLSNKQSIYMRKKRKILVELMGKRSREGKPACKCCGEDNLIYLQVDHVNNDGYEDKNGNTWRNKTTVNQYLENPKKYQLLCANCNYAKHKNGGKLYKPNKKRKVV